MAGYADSPPALRGCTVEARRGRRLAVLGANGSGKTTLLRCLSGSLRPRSGGVELDGHPLAYGRGGLRRHRERVQLVLQDPDDQLFSADVSRDVSFGPLNLGCSEEETRARVQQTLELLGLVPLADRPTHQLSYGERKRVAIAGAVAMRPEFLLLDEPTAGLDPVGVDDLLATLDVLEAHGTTVVVSTHDVALALEWASDAAVITSGRILQGTPAELLGKEDLLERAQLKMPWPMWLSAQLRARGLVPADVHPTSAAEVIAALERARVVQLAQATSPDGPSRSGERGVSATSGPPVG